MTVEMSKHNTYSLQQENQENLSLLLSHVWVQVKKFTQAIPVTLRQSQICIIAGL
jgi:hypothetical protein